jgi:hypothetical protein
MEKAPLKITPASSVLIQKRLAMRPDFLSFFPRWSRAASGGPVDDLALEIDLIMQVAQKIHTQQAVELEHGPAFGWK